MQTVRNLQSLNGDRIDLLEKILEDGLIHRVLREPLILRMAKIERPRLRFRQRRTMKEGRCNGVRRVDESPETLFRVLAGIAEECETVEARWLDGSERGNDREDFCNPPLLAALEFLSSSTSKEDDDDDDDDDERDGQDGSIETLCMAELRRRRRRLLLSKTDETRYLQLITLLHELWYRRPGGPLRFLLHLAADGDLSPPARATLEKLLVAHDDAMRVMKDRRPICNELVGAFCHPAPFDVADGEVPTESELAAAVARVPIGPIEEGDGYGGGGRERLFGKKSDEEGGRGKTEGQRRLNVTVLENCMEAYCIAVERELSRRGDVRLFRNDYFLARNRTALRVPLELLRARNVMGIVDRKDLVLCNNREKTNDCTIKDFF